MSYFRKDPDAILDYAYDWTDWLTEGDTIDTYTIDPEDGITVDSDDDTGSVVTVWLSGGTLGEKYRVTCRIVTVDGRTDDRTITVQITRR